MLDLQAIFTEFIQTNVPPATKGNSFWSLRGISQWFRGDLKNPNNRGITSVVDSIQLSPKLLSFISHSLTHATF